MKILNKFRKPSLSIFLASLVLFVSCEQYDMLPEKRGVLDKDTIAQIKKATIQLINDYKNNPNNFEITNDIDIENEGDRMINEAIMLYVSDDLDTYKENVFNFTTWNDQQFGTIEAIFVVLETLQENFTLDDISSINPSLITLECGQGAWWAPLGFYAMCITVGLVSFGLAGAVCAGLIAARSSYCNYQMQHQ